jgi:hypothetical protein
MRSNLIPEGTYPAVACRVTTEAGDEVIAQWGFAKAKERGKKGTKQCLIYFEIVEGEHEGERCPWFGYFGANSYKRTLQSLRFAGWKGDDLTSINAQPMDQLVSVVIEHNAWTNEDGEEQLTARVAWVNRPGSGTIKMRDPMSSDDLVRFAAQMRAYLHEAPEEEGRRVERIDRQRTEQQIERESTVAIPETVNDYNDDIPF